MSIESFSVLLAISPKTYGNSNDTSYRKNVRDTIFSLKGPWNRMPIVTPSIVLKFGISPERLRKGKNDLDNLSKLILDALSVQIKYGGSVWKGYGIIDDDSAVRDLVLIKRSERSEFVKILVFGAEQREEFCVSVYREVKDSST